MIGPDGAGRQHPGWERISPADALELTTDVGPVPMQVGAVLLLDPPASFDLRAAIRLVADRASGVPRLRQRLLGVPWWCGRPIWVDDPSFDAAAHVRRRACPPPGDEPALLDLAAELVAQPLPRHRPLWAATMVTGLRDDRVALVFAFHHVLADGLGGLAVLAGLVDGAPSPSVAPAGRRPPSRSELVQEASRARLRALARLPNSLRSARPALSELGIGRPQRLPRSSLNRPTGPRRRYVAMDAGLAAVRDAADRHGATVNDAVLSAIAGALRSVLESRGERLDRLVASVPVSARQAPSVRLGNHVGVMPIAVPAAADPWVRLARVAGVTRARKGTARGASLAILGPAFRLLAALGAFRWFIDHQRLVHTFVTNVRGPERPVTLAGAPVASIIPLSGTTGNVTVAFAVLSYCGTLTFTVVADPDRVPDLPVLVDELRAQLAVLAPAGPVTSRLPGGRPASSNH